MKIRETISRFASNIQTWSVRKIVSVIGVLVAGMYVLFFVVPRPVAFSYADTTCTRQLTVLPDTERTIGTTAFRAEYSGGFSLGKTRILTTKLCFIPTTAPQEGSVKFATAPWGWYMFRSHYTLKIPSTPKVLAAKTTAPIASTKAVTYSIDQTDTVFTYVLAKETHKSTCSVENSTLSCNLAPLALAQGTDHTVTLTKAFAGKTVDEVMKTTISVLPAVNVTGSTPTANQTVYDKPTSFSFTTDKTLMSADATLVQLDGDTTTKIDTEVSTNDKTVLVTLASELAREKQFKLTLKSAEATDGSTTTAPQIVDFSTSGGPKVTGVNIGTSGIDPNARVIVTLDQPLADSVDITKFVHVSGVGASLAKQGQQIVIGIQNAARCTPFTITVDKGLTSASNSLVSSAGWSYVSRVNCRATATIGYSVKGRPIVAYYYGSGATTILFTGGMHGSERSGQQTMQAWASYLDSNAQSIPAGRQVVIVPNTNPDGIAANSRNNARNVNIDRNFATADWKADIDTSSGTLVGGGGSAPMSEPETQALGALTLQLNPRLQVSYHAAGRLVGANDWADSRAIGSVYASTVGYSTMFGSSAEETMGYTFSGQYEDFIGQKLGKPAILIELPTASGNYLNSQLNALWKMVNI